MKTYTASTAATAAMKIGLGMHLFAVPGACHAAKPFLQIRLITRNQDALKVKLQ